MAEKFFRNKGRPGNFKLDRGGAPTEGGPFIGEVRNNSAPTRSGRLQVFIEEFAGDEKDDPSLWRTVSYLSPFFGVTEQSGTGAGVGDYVGNRHSYGMWFTPPDIGTRVLCFFANGDPNRGFYVGCIPAPGLSHMVPAIGSSENLKNNNTQQDKLFKNSSRLPVTEINSDNPELSEDPRFFDSEKPVHSYLAGVMFQQGLINDRVRGPIGSSSQRESPSTVYGISTPGRPIYQGGLSEADIKSKLEKGEVSNDKVKVIGRRGGHTLVMDDGDIEGKDQLLRLRTSKGHQLLFSDDGDCIHLIHCNGQSWIELGKEGTVDVYATNSINLRTEGNMNFHSGKSMNFYSQESVNIVAKTKLQMESESAINVISQGETKMHSNGGFGILSNTTFSLLSLGSITQSTFGSMSLSGTIIDLNGGSYASVLPPQPIQRTLLPDVEYDPEEGWRVIVDKTQSIVDRMPTHEPYQAHNQGVNVTVAMAPAAAPLPLPVPASVSSALSGIAGVNLELPINATDFITQAKAISNIGPISVDQVSGMIAQQAKQIGQAVTDITEKGIGKFGFSVDQLEDIGLVKPGTAALAAATQNISEFMKSPQIWSGVDGIKGINDLLGSDKIQDQLQEKLLSLKFTELDTQGILDSIPNTSDIAGLVQSAASFGTENVAALINGKLDSIVGGALGSVNEVIGKINSVAKLVGFAADFVGFKLPGSLKKAKRVVGYVGKTVRGGVDSSVTEIIGNDKVPKIKY
jgi:hypothetical protein